MQSAPKSIDFGETPTTFTLGYVPGVTPAKWIKAFRQRQPRVTLELVQLDTRDRGLSIHTGQTDVSLVRLPFNRNGLHAITLYEEVPVVVFPKDHHFAAADELSVDDLTEEIVLHPLDDTLQWDRFPGRPALERPADTKSALELVAAGIGVLVVPQSLARLHHRKDLTYLALEGAPGSSIALVWKEFDESPLVEEFMGVVRGRTVNSSRGTGQNSVGQNSTALGNATRQESSKQKDAKSKKAAASRTATGHKANAKQGGRGRTGAGKPAGSSKSKHSARGAKGANRGGKKR